MFGTQRIVQKEEGMASLVGLLCPGFSGSVFCQTSWQYLRGLSPLRNGRDGLVQRPDLGFRRLLQPSWARVSAGSTRGEGSSSVYHSGMSSCKGAVKSLVPTVSLSSLSSVFVVVQGGWSRVRRLSAVCPICASKFWRPSWSTCTLCDTP